MASSSRSSATVRRIPYRYPWAVYIPTVILFGLLNYLVLGETVSEDGTHLVMPAYVATLQRHYPDSFVTRAAVTLERDIMAGLFLVGRRVFRGMTGVQAVWVTAWIIHFFELGMCVRICVACHASAWTMLRYCFCTVTAGFAQLVPLQQERAVYLGKHGAKAADTPASKSKPAKASPRAASKSSPKKAKQQQQKKSQ